MEKLGKQIAPVKCMKTLAEDRSRGGGGRIFEGERAYIRDEMLIGLHIWGRVFGVLI